MLLVIPATAILVYMFRKWRKRWTRLRGFVFGACVGVHGSLFLGFQCAAGVMALPGAWIVNNLGGRGHPLWLLAVAMVNAAIYGLPGMLLPALTPDPPPSGHCQSCGYDLTGNTSGRCPECGEAI